MIPDLEKLIVIWFHTDGTYVKEKTDWFLMSKIQEKNVKGGETTLLHWWLGASK